MKLLGSSLKFFANCQPANNCFGKSWAALNLAFMASDASFFQNKEARDPMPVFKYFTVGGSALLVFLFVSDAYFGDYESNSRFNGSLYESALYAPRSEVTDTAELRFTRE